MNREQLRTIVVDDEPLARRHLEKLLAREPEVTITASCRNAREAQRAVDEQPPDLAFVDIEMPGGSGLDLARTLRDSGAVVVFVTAHAEHGAAAFDTDAADYLLKPFDEPRFARAMQRARARIERAHEEPAGAASPSRLVVDLKGRLRLVDPARVDWIEAAGKHVLLHIGRETVPHRDSLRSLSSRLGKAFVRVHRGALVRTDAIREIYPGFKGEWIVALHSGDQVAMSRRFRSRLHLDRSRLI